MGHLVANDHADGTVVDDIVGLHIEVGRLQDGGREAYLVSGWFIVGIDGLRRHLPFSGVHRLAGTLSDKLRIPEAETLDDVLHVGLATDDVQVAHIGPLVGVAHLHDEGGEFLLGCGFCGITHPVLCVDALCEGHLQVADQLEHALLGGGGEVLLDEHLAHCLAHQVVHLRRDALP